MTEAAAFCAHLTRIIHQPIGQPMQGDTDIGGYHNNQKMGEQPKASQNNINAEVHHVFLLFLIIEKWVEQTVNAPRVFVAYPLPAKMPAATIWPCGVWRA